MPWLGTVLLLVWLAANATPAAAAAGAHVHGQGVLDVSVDEDGRVELFLTAPLADLQTETIDGPEAMIQREDLFEFDGASCRFETSQQETTPVFEDTWAEPEHQEAASEDAHEHEHEEAHEHEHEEQHAHAQEKDHGHEEEHAHAHDGDHAGHGDGHEDHDGGSHSDSYLTWIYQCDTSPQQLRVMLFEDTHLEQLAVQAVSSSGVDSATLTSSDNEIELP